MLAGDTINKRFVPCILCMLKSYEEDVMNRFKPYKEDVTYGKDGACDREK